MQTFKSLLLVFLLPAFGYSQQLSGIWTGTLSNDSLTVRKDQSFEIGLTEYRDKVYGYAYSTFVVNDTLFYIIKRVKGEIKNGVCIVEDDEIITHNFQRKPDKGVRVEYTFHQNQQDSTWTIDGNWKTNTTKKYYSISGGINALQEKDISRSKLYDHLGDLNLQQTLSFNNPRDIKSEKRTPVVTDAKKSVTKTNVKPVDDKPKTVNPNPPKQEVKNDIAKVEQKPVDNKQINDIIKADTKKSVDTNAIVQKPKVKTDVAVTDQKINEKKPAEDFVYAELKKSERKLKPAAEMVAERTSVPSETIYFKSDSLVLALYDNGEVDGDTVSVIMNGEIIIEKQVLKSAAFKKTIYLAPDESDSVLLVLYAENLGLYPPNTGLLIVKDGEESFYVRFKADYDQNAAILLRRKPK
jgi:hypothetical protein